MNYSKEQQSAIESTAGQIISLCSPGSGKTRTLVARIERLVDAGGDSRQMAAITYTAAAAGELQSRLKHKLGFCGTLHAFCLRLIKHHHALVNLPGQVTVMDDESRDAALLQIAKEMNCKSSLKKLKEVTETFIGLTGKQTKRFSTEELVAVQFHRQMLQNGVLDFGTILFFGLQICKTLKNSAMLIESGLWFHRHIFVDEIQDAADIDTQIYTTVLADTRFLVGDVDQAIYGFRGGNVRNAVRLAVDPSVAPRWELHTLSTNYRSGSAICEHAQRLIDHNKNRVVKQMVADTRGGEVECWRCSVPGDEMGRVMTAIIEHQREPVQPSIAVLCRTNRVADGIADFLRSTGIQVAEKEREEMPTDWRLCKLYLTLMANPYNDFVADQFVALRDGEAKATQVKADCAIRMVSINEGYLKFTTEKTFDLSAFSMESIARVQDATSRLSMLGAVTLPELVAHLCSGERKAEHGAGVVVTTMHASKGLEWSIVFMCGMEQEIMPGNRANIDIEEERRLAFVGMTRAKKRLVITWCKARPKPFGREMQDCQPSQFIAEAGL